MSSLQVETGRAAAAPVLGEQHAKLAVSMSAIHTTGQRPSEESAAMTPPSEPAAQEHSVAADAIQIAGGQPTEGSTVLTAPAEQAPQEVSAPTGTTQTTGHQPSEMSAVLTAPAGLAVQEASVAAGATQAAGVQPPEESAVPNAPAEPVGQGAVGGTGPTVVAQLSSSQYSFGASSACTLMTIEAALRTCATGRCMNDEELAQCVQSAAAYDCSLHLAADDVLEHCPRYSSCLESVQNYTGEPFGDFDIVVKKMKELCNTGGRKAVAAVVTKSPETLLVSCCRSQSGDVEWSIFDSHVRAHHAGAAVLSFANDSSALMSYLHELWPLTFIEGLDEGQAFMLHCFDAGVLALKSSETAESVCGTPLDVSSLKAAIALRELEKLQKENADLRRQNGLLERSVANANRRALEAEFAAERLRDELYGGGVSLLGGLGSSLGSSLGFGGGGRDFFGSGGGHDYGARGWQGDSLYKDDPVVRIDNYSSHRRDAQSSGTGTIGLRDENINGNGQSRTGAMPSATDAPIAASRASDDDAAMNSRDPDLERALQLSMQ